MFRHVGKKAGDTLGMFRKLSVRQYSFDPENSAETLEQRIIQAKKFAEDQDHYHYSGPKSLPRGEKPSTTTTAEVSKPVVTENVVNPAPTPKR